MGLERSVIFDDIGVIEFLKDIDLLSAFFDPIGSSFFMNLQKIQNFHGKFPFQLVFDKPDFAKKASPNQFHLGDRLQIQFGLGGTLRISLNFDHDFCKILEIFFIKNRHFLNVFINRNKKQNQNYFS